MPGAGRGRRLQEAWHLFPRPGQHVGSGGSSWPRAGGQTPQRLGEHMSHRGPSVLKNSLRRVPQKGLPVAEERLGPALGRGGSGRWPCRDLHREPGLGQGPSERGARVS